MRAGNVAGTEHHRRDTETAGIARLRRTVQSAYLSIRLDPARLFQHTPDKRNVFINLERGGVKGRLADLVFRHTVHCRAHLRSRLLHGFMRQQTAVQHDLAEIGNGIRLSPPVDRPDAQSRKTESLMLRTRKQLFCKLFQCKHQPRRFVNGVVSCGNQTGMNRDAARGHFPADRSFMGGDHIQRSSLHDNRRIRSEMIGKNGFRAEKTRLLVTGAGHGEPAARPAAPFQFKQSKQRRGKRSFVIRDTKAVITAVLLKRHPEWIGHFRYPYCVGMGEAGKKRSFRIPVLCGKLKNDRRTSGNRFHPSLPDSVPAGKRTEIIGNAGFSRQIVAMPDTARIHAGNGNQFFQQLKRIHEILPS